MTSAREHEQHKVGRSGDSIRIARAEIDGNPGLACEYCRRCALFPFFFSPFSSSRNHDDTFAKPFNHYNTNGLKHRRKAKWYQLLAP